MPSLRLPGFSRPANHLGFITVTHHDKPKVEDFFRPGNELALKHFLQFCMSEHTYDALAFLIAEKAFQEAPDRNKLGFMTSYFTVQGAPLELNLGTPQKKQLSTQVQALFVKGQQSSVSGGAVPRNFFQGIATHCANDLLDNLSRYHNEMLEMDPKGQGRKYLLKQFGASRLAAIATHKPVMKDLFFAMRGMGLRPPAWSDKL